MDEHYWIRLLPWRRKKAESKSAQIPFAPHLTIIREEVGKDLELLLVNRCSFTVWVEEASVFLSDLEADVQAVAATGQARHPILQNVGPNETLSVSLARAIYEAAGRPQGPCSCLVLTNVSYRVFNEWCSVSGWQCLPWSIFIEHVGTLRR